MGIPTAVLIVGAVVTAAFLFAAGWVFASIAAERRAERQYKADPEGFFEKERQDTGRYDLPKLLAKVTDENRHGEIGLIDGGEEKP